MGRPRPLGLILATLASEKNMSARTRTPVNPCARWWNHENGIARRITRRGDRRAARAFLRAVDVDAVVAPRPRRTSGYLTH